MNKKKQLPKSDVSLLAAVLATLCFGLLAVSSASTVLSFERFGHNHYYILRQLLYGVIPGLVLLYFCSRIDYHVWQRLAPLLILVGVVLLIAVFIPGIGFKVGNARRWINFGLFLFQPAEFVKLATILYLASWFDKRKQDVHDLYFGFLPSMAIVVVLAGLIMLEPDIGTMLVLAAIAGCMFFAGGAQTKHLLSAAGLGLLVIWIAIKAAPYRLQRFLAYFNPQTDVTGISYQINQALLAIGSGGLWGLGFGQSRQKYNYLPEPIGDSIFAIMSEELGLIRVTLILALFAWIGYRGFKIALAAPDNFAKMAAVGLTSWIVLQALINLGGITAVIPLTGIPMPFISYGSSALVFNLAGIGILLNISRYARK